MKPSSSIVVCDNDAPSRRLITGLLEGAGFSCIAVEKGADIAPAVTDSSADVVLLDVTLPDMDGTSLVKQLRALEQDLGYKLFIIALSSDRKMSEQFIDHGGDAVFSRPFNAQKLIVTVQRAIHRRNAGQQLPGRGAGVPFNQSVMLQTTPPSSGVITLRDSDGRAILVEWATNIRQRLQWYLSSDDAPARQVAAGTASADFIVTDDRSVAGAVFDREVSSLDDYPLFTKDPPTGSCHEGKGVESIPMTDHALSLDRPIDPQELKEARRQLEENPDNLQAKDWYAFMCYRCGHHEEAIHHFAELVDGGSEKSEHFFYLGCALEAVGNIEIAVEMWQKVAEREPESRLGRKCRRHIDQVAGSQTTH